jgi:hypothetical protein
MSCFFGREIQTPIENIFAAQNSKKIKNYYNGKFEEISDKSAKWSFSFLGRQYINISTFLLVL